MKPRIFYLDTVGGLLLIHMIIGHCTQWAHLYNDYNQWTFWLSFFMPWFFFKNGMFFKDTAINEVLVKSFQRLIVPWIWFGLLGIIVNVIKHYIESDNISIGYLLYIMKQLIRDGAPVGNLALWFLLSLFLVRVIFALIFNHYKRVDGRVCKYLWGGVFTLICLTWFIVDLLSQKFGWKYPCWVSNISCGMIFFSLGFWLKDSKLRLWQILFGFIVVTSVWYFFPSQVDMRTGNIIRGFRIVWMMNSLISILTINNLFRLVINRKNWLAQVGINTMPFYCLHWPIIVVVSIFFGTIVNADWKFLWTLLVANTLLLPLFTYLLRHSRFRYII